MLLTANGSLFAVSAMDGGIETFPPEGFVRSPSDPYEVHIGSFFYHPQAGCSVWGGGGHKRKGTDVWKGTLINYLIRSWHDLLSQPKTHVVERVFVIGFHVVFVSRI